MSEISTDDYERPYIPPEGIVPEVLLRDDCTSWEDEKISEHLLPLDRFDHPLLRAVPPHKHAGIETPVESLNSFLRKNCAGLSMTCARKQVRFFSHSEQEISLRSSVVL